MASNKELFLSIIIINYNTIQLTYECISSIYEYTSDIHFEIILIDNGSNEFDGTIFLQKFPEIKLIILKENLGFSKGNNIGIQHAKGNFILLLNSDTKLKNNAIKITTDYLTQHPQAGVVSSKLVYADGKHQSVCQRFPSIRHKLFELFRIHKLFSSQTSGKILLGAFFNHDENIKTDWVWGAFFLFRKEILNFLPNNKLNDDFFMYCEDMQWCWDIKKTGYEIHYCADAEIIHYMGGSSGKKNDLMKHNYFLFLRKNYILLHRWGIELINKLLV